MENFKVFTKEETVLGRSIHFAIKENDEEYQELNCGYGILFAKAEIMDNNTLLPKTLGNPRVFCEDEEYLIFAEEREEDGSFVDDGEILLFRTKDFVSFTEQEKVSVNMFEKEIAEAVAELCLPGNILTELRDRWLPPYAVGVEITKDNKAVVTYSDGSKDVKKIDEKTGEPIRETIEFPMAVGFADPVVFHWEGYWYFLATNDNLDDIGIYVRRASSVKGLFAEDVEIGCILDYDETRELIQTFWAPEFHVIGGELYILFAVGGRQWAPQCHMMKLKKGGDIMNPGDWEDPIRVCKKDGTFLTEDGITLDMTYFKVQDTSYLAWSYRYGIGTPLDTGSMIYIATTDEKKPWVLTSEPVLISRPLYGWENTEGTINNEGPYPLLLGDKVYLAFSGGAAGGYTYAIGYLVAKAGTDLLQPDSWKKEPSPVLCSTYIPGIDGPGHNSFFYDEEGKLMVAYHAQETEKFHTRCTTMHRVHIGKNGFPFLNMSPERDL